MYYTMLLLHLLGATVWIGGHLILLFRYLPQALWKKDLPALQAFETRFEVIGIPALLIQVATGIWLAQNLVPFSLWGDWKNPLAHGIQAKLLFLGVTALLAVDARLRVIPKLSEKNIGSLAAHIVPVTLIAVLFGVVGLLFRFGGIQH
jgi:putative copper export protein